MGTRVGPRPLGGLRGNMTCAELSGGPGHQAAENCRCWPPTLTPGRKMFQEGWRGSKDRFRVKHVKGNWVALILELGRL